MSLNIVVKVIVRLRFEIRNVIEVKRLVLRKATEAWCVQVPSWRHVRPKPYLSYLRILQKFSALDFSVVVHIINVPRLLKTVSFNSVIYLGIYVGLVITLTKAKRIIVNGVTMIEHIQLIDLNRVWSIYRHLRFLVMLVVLAS